jgi:hypothetical protein
MNYSEEDIQQDMAKIYLLNEEQRNVYEAVTGSVLGIVPAYKKGDITAIQNYRPISLTSVIRRTFERTLLPYVMQYDDRLADNQGGFRPQRNCYDQINVVQELTKKYPEAIHIFLDLRTAYDLVDRNILWSRIAEYQETTETNVTRQRRSGLIATLRALFDNNYSKLMINGTKSSIIANRRGLLQGSSLSPLLFNHFINSMILKINQHPKLNIHGALINNLLYADDTYLIALTKKIAQQMLNSCVTWAEAHGMSFAPEKSVIVSKRKVSLTMSEEVNL